MSKEEKFSSLEQMKAVEKLEKASKISNKFLKFHFLKFPLSATEVILAKCAECMNDYIDGKEDCGMTDCPLYPYMPYSKEKKLSSSERKEKIKEFYSKYDKDGNLIDENTPKENLVSKFYEDGE